MKDIRSEYVGRRMVKKITKLIFSGALVFALVLVVPGNYHVAYAAPLEDCDLDGFDDATGVPVPWPGYDETKGDTPDGPAGSKNPTTTPSANSSSGNTGATETSGNNGGGASGNTGSTGTDKTDSAKSEETKTGSSKDNASGKNNDSKSSNTTTGSTDKTTSQTSSKTGSTAKNSSKSGTDKAASTTSESTSKSSPTSGNSTSGSSGSGNTSSNSASSNTDKTVKDNKAETDNTSNTAQNESNTEAETTASGDTESIGTDETDRSESEAETSQSKADVPETEQQPVVADNETTEASEISDDVLAAAVNTKGSLEIKEASGSILHAGSSVIVSGTGFAGNVQNLELVIQSELRQLGFVESSAEGSFEAQLAIPEDLSAGVHHIVVLYEGNEITRQEIEVGPKAADSFLQALSVGFTTENHGLVPGLLILLGLIVAGTGVLGYSVLFHSNKRKVNS